jgi:hypothetical protein
MAEEDKIKEVVDILGAQFSRLQIASALVHTSNEINEAIDYLMNQNCNPFQTFYQILNQFIVSDEKEDVLFSSDIVAKV